MPTNLAKQLYDLQQIDLDLEAKREALRQAQSQLGETQTLRESRDALKQAQERLVSLEKEQRTIEGEIDDIQAKISAREKELYKNSGKPKELESLEKEVKRSKAQKREKEDKALETMSLIEEQHQEIVLKRSEVEKVEKSWQERQNQLLLEIAKIEGLLTEGEQRQRALAASIDPASRQLYETLRMKKQGRAVAKVEQGRCQGCRLTLPLRDLQQVRISEQLTHCSSCGRILYLAT